MLTTRNLSDMYSEPKAPDLTRLREFGAEVVLRFWICDAASWRCADDCWVVAGPGQRVRQASSSKLPPEHCQTQALEP